MTSLAADDPGSLDRLVDIVPAPPAPWWPPAPGWFLVGAALLLGIMARAVQFVRFWRANAYRRAAFRELGELVAASEADPSRWSELPPLLKRVALVAYPRAMVAELSGDAWLQFLEETAAFGREPGQTLLALAYDPQATRRRTRDEFLKLAAAAGDWIRFDQGALPRTAVDAEAARC